MAASESHDNASMERSKAPLPPQSAAESILSLQPDVSSQEARPTATSPVSNKSMKFFEASEHTQHHSDSSERSVKSETSTIRHGHEPFESFRERIESLCHQVWVSGPASSRLKDRIAQFLRLNITRKPQPPRPLKFEFERMFGGYNRIIGIDVVDEISAHRKRYIIRMPRCTGIARPDRDVAILEYIRKHSSIPIPTVVKSDYTTRNPLGSSYVIQERIPGKDLQNSDRRFPSLTFEQKVAFTKGFAKILTQIMALQSNAPGQIEPTSKRINKKDFQIRHFKVEDNYHGDLRTPDDLSFSNSTPAYRSTLAFFQSQFDRWGKVAAGRNIGKVMFMERLSAMATQMDEAGFLRDNENCLCHLDLATAPRNILVDVTEDGSLTITGILDWDEAVFAPKFVACTPPMWIWAWSDDEDEDESKADETPKTEEGKKLKNIFEQEIGQEFLRYAYKPEYRVARRLFDFALQGIHSSWKMEEADNIIDEWALLRPKGMPQIESLRTPSEDDRFLMNCEVSESL